MVASPMPHQAPPAPLLEECVYCMQVASLQEYILLNVEHDIGGPLSWVQYIMMAVMMTKVLKYKR